MSSTVELRKITSSDGVKNERFDKNASKGNENNQGVGAANGMEGCQLESTGWNNDNSVELSWSGNFQQEHNSFVRIIAECQNGAGTAWEKNKKFLWKTITVLLVLGYCVYFGLAMRHEFGSEASVRLLWVTSFAVVCFLVHLVSKYSGRRMENSFRCWTEFMGRHSNTIPWILVGLVYLCVLVFVTVDIAYLTGNVYNLVSASGILVFVLLFFIFSHSPVHVNWRTVSWGLGLQFLLALIVLRWDAGYRAFEWLGDRIVEFMEHASAGAVFVFGETYTDHFFAFKVSSVIIFFNCAVVVLFYLGWIQVVIRKIAFIMAYTMGTTAVESLCAAANVFLAMTEGPLLVRPFLQYLTRSELHAVLTGGFATVSGSGIVSYALMGVPANHLLSASVMSAPAALAIAKLSYPETQVSRTTVHDLQAQKAVSTYHNIIEAASAGASEAVKVVASIMANLIAFISMLHFLNSVLTWFGDRVGIEELTFELICSYVLFPFALVMGVELDDCRRVAKLIGIKTFLNEFVAFIELGQLVTNRDLLDEHVAKNGTWFWKGDDIILRDKNITLLNGVLSDRSEVISTYALCGFANFASIGILIGSIGSMAPNQKVVLSELALRAMIAGTAASFLTACVAGVLYQG